MYRKNAKNRDTKNSQRNCPKMEKFGFTIC